MLKLEDLNVKVAVGKARLCGREVEVSLVGDGVLADLREVCPSPFVPAGGAFDAAVQAELEADQIRMGVLKAAAAVGLDVHVAATVPTEAGATKTLNRRVTAQAAHDEPDKAVSKALMRAWADAAFAAFSKLGPALNGVKAELRRLEDLDLYAEAVKP